MGSDAAIAAAKRRNAEPLGGCLDRALAARWLESRPLIFSDTRIFVAAPHLELMAAFVAAMERITVLPGWRERTLAGAPAWMADAYGARGVFFGYDFHITEAGPKLIEINTNAGGGWLNAFLLQAQCDPRAGMADGAALTRDFAMMFEEEWRAAGRDGKPARIAIVDDEPATQYLNPDFELCRDALRARGLDAGIYDAAELVWRDDELRDESGRVDMVYNRLTDFQLEDPHHAPLHEAWRAGAAVVTPNPLNYRLFADKRNLVLLSDADWLAGIGVAAADIAVVAQVVPRTELVEPSRAEDIHARRKQLFFKPSTGYGSKATYRGLNVTNRVFGEIIKGGYVAQELVPPATRVVKLEDKLQELKYDLRSYAYAGRVQLVAARLWQGQTTNFRTPGGGFTPVVRVE